MVTSEAIALWVADAFTGVLALVIIQPVAPDASLASRYECPVRGLLVARERDAGRW